MRYRQHNTVFVGIKGAVLALDAASGEQVWRAELKGSEFVSESEARRSGKAVGRKILRQRLPSLQILMLTVYAEQELIFDSICNGACGYLLKKTPPARLLEAIREAHEGGAPMSPEIARKVVTLFQKTVRPESVDQQLTAHELRLLRLLAQGCSYEAVADQFSISINTVRNHIRRVYEKLHVHSKSEAVSKALRSRLIT